jgi:hypothetical protein
MTGSRVLAIFVAACALAASALIALPLDGAEAPDETIAVSTPDRFYDLAARPNPATAESSDETHTALPRLWLGSPVAR